MASRSPLCLIASRLTRPWLVQQARWCPHLSCLSLRGVSTSTTASAASAEPTTSPSLQEIEWPRWQPSSRRTGLIALKRGMTSFIDEWGVVHACTVLQVDQCQVIKINTPHDTDHYGLEIGCTPAKEKHVTTPLAGHFKKQNVPPKRKVVEFMISEDALLPIGTELTALHFAPGQYVDIKGTSVGKGFQGVMKRWGFAGGPASHGTSLAHRTPGSVGQNSKPSRVFPGKKMPGQMGNKSSTVLNLKVLKVDPVQNLIYIKGAIPGHDNNYVVVRDAVMKWREHYVSDNKTVARPPFPLYIPDPTQRMTAPILSPKAAEDPLALDT